MKDILALSFELQAVLVCGYLGYCIASIGHRVTHSTEDRLFQILSFGFLSLLSYYLLRWLAFFPLPNQTLETSTIAANVIQAICMLVFTLFFASIWKSFFKKWLQRLLSIWGVSNEDNYPNVIGSIIHGHSRFTWDYIHLHMNDGRTIRSDLVQLKQYSPTGSIPLIDAEGNVALYVTTIYRENGDSEDFSPLHENGAFKLSYYPKDKISEIEICWRKPT